jgi:hypothetical protein
VGEVDEDLDALLDDLVTLLASNAGDESDAARIMLVSRVVQPLGRGKTMARGGQGHPSCLHAA